jgi:hypothetical protein
MRTVAGLNNFLAQHIEERVHDSKCRSKATDSDESGAGNELILASVIETPGRHSERWNTIISMLLDVGSPGQSQSLKKDGEN